MTARRGGKDQAMTVAESDDGQGDADLGDIDRAILVFGGPYGNLEATEAVLSQAERHGIAPEHTICTGDVAAYSADPQATADRLREAGVAVVMGNTDESLGLGVDDCGCGYDEGSVCDLLSRRWFAYAAAHTDDDTKRWMGNLPRKLDLRLGGYRLSVVHGGGSQVNRFVFPSTPAGEKAAEIAASGGDGVIAGHSGLPFTEVIGGKLWHNAGVIGQPANDGTPRVWYSTLRVAGGGIRIEHHALGYDHAAAAAKMRRAELPEEYAASLGTGLWHNCDVMPPEEAARRARRLAPEPVLWMREADERAAG
jgi:predicted phosphodiesterase